MNVTVAVEYWQNFKKLDVTNGTWWLGEPKQYVVNNPVVEHNVTIVLVIFMLSMFIWMICEIGKEYMNMKQFPRYFISTAAFAVVGLGVYWYFVDVLHFTAVAVTLTYVPLSFIVRYFVEKGWVFK